MRLWRRIRAGAFACLIMLTCAACGGGGDDEGSEDAVPPEAAMAQATLASRMGKFTPYMAGAQASLLLLLNADAGQTPDIVLQPDPSPGAPPHAYVFQGRYDGNADGAPETSLAGAIRYAGDPASLQWSPATGHAEVDVDIPIGGHIYEAALDYRVTLTEVRLSGTGSFRNPVTGETVSVAVDPANPLVIKSVTPQSGGVANACGYEIVGTLPVQLSSSDGKLNSNWVFSSGSASVATRQTVYTDPSGRAVELADASTTLTCGGGAALTDWEATYDQHWVCIPFEHGNARLTISATSADTLTIDDEDPPGSGDFNTYRAAKVGGSAHAVQGFFDGGPVGNRYREHFTWTRDKDGNFAQWSTYIYTEGPNLGSGGVCAARARR